MGFKLNLKGKNKDVCDAGGSVPAGWYLTTCTYVNTEARSKTAGTALIEFQFTIKDGPFKSQILNWSLLNPEEITDAGKAEKALQRIESVASRMGLLNGQYGSDSADVDFDAAFERDFVVEVAAERQYQKDGETKTQPAGISYLGVFEPDSVKITEATRKALKLPPVGKYHAKANAGAGAGAGAGTTNGKARMVPADNFNDL